MSSPSQTTTLQINLPALGRATHFSYFQSSHSHIVRILSGETYPIVPNIGSVNTIVDVGANVGAASVMLAATYPAAIIHAFEPGVEPGKLLPHNVSPFPNVKVHQYGLDSADAETKLYRSSWDPMSASVLPSAENTDAYDTIRLRKASAALREHGVEAVDILKIDTEGCEVPVMNDIAELVAKARVIYLEYHSDADRRRIDAMLEPSHVLAHASARQPHRGDVCYVHRDTGYAKAMAAMAITR